MKSIFFIILIQLSSGSIANPIANNSIQAHWTGKQDGFQGIYFINFAPNGHFYMKRIQSIGTKTIADSVGYGKEHLFYYVRSIYNGFNVYIGFDSTKCSIDSSLQLKINILSRNDSNYISQIELILDFDSSIIKNKIILDRIDYTYDKKEVYIYTTHLGGKIELTYSKNSYWNSYSMGWIHRIEPNDSFVVISKELSKSIFKYTNLFRKQNQSDTLSYNLQLENAAQCQSDYLTLESRRIRSLIITHDQDSTSPYFKGAVVRNRILLYGDKVYIATCGENALLSWFPDQYFDNKQLTHFQKNKIIDSIGRVLVFNQWANSPGHRANMLRSEYEKIGVGVVVALYKVDDDFYYDKNGIKQFPSKEDKSIYWYCIYAIQVFAKITGNF